MEIQVEEGNEVILVIQEKKIPLPRLEEYIN